MVSILCNDVVEYYTTLDTDEGIVDVRVGIDRGLLYVSGNILKLPYDMTKQQVDNALSNIGIKCDVKCVGTFYKKVRPEAGYWEGRYV